MALVTDIRALRPGSRARELVVDGEPFRTTSADVVRALGIKPGSVQPLDELAARLDSAEPRAARERALRLLGYRDRSASDLRSRLVADGYPASVAADVVADLSHVSLVDDERYAANAARTLTSARGLGRSRALRELTTAGVDPHVAAEAVDAALSTEEEADSARQMARALARRPRADVQRIVARLVRRGYPLPVAVRVAREEIDAAGLEFPDDGSDTSDDATAGDDASSDLPVSGD